MHEHLKLQTLPKKNAHSTVALGPLASQVERCRLGHWGGLTNLPCRVGGSELSVSRCGVQGLVFQGLGLMQSQKFLVWGS